MIRTRFENIEFIEFIHTLRDLNLSLSEWGAKDPKNIWDLEVIYSQTFLEDNWDTSIDPWTTANGVNHLNVKSYAKKIIYKIKKYFR